MLEKGKAQNNKESCSGLKNKAKKPQNPRTNELLCGCKLYCKPQLFSTQYSEDKTGKAFVKHITIISEVLLLPLTRKQQEVIKAKVTCGEYSVAILLPFHQLSALR